MSSFNISSKNINRDKYLAFPCKKILYYYYHYYYLCLCRPSTSVVKTSTETSTLPFPLTVVFQVNQFSISSRGAARRGRKWRVVAVTSLPVGFIRLLAASAVALRHWSLPLLNTIFLFRIILINNLTQRMYTGTFKGILTLFRLKSVFIQHNIFQGNIFLICWLMTLFNLVIYLYPPSVYAGHLYHCR